jgi:hypothetical protein
MQVIRDNCEVFVEQKMKDSTQRMWSPVLLLYELTALLFDPSRRMRWAGHVARMGEKKNVYR